VNPTISAKRMLKEEKIFNLFFVEIQFSKVQFKRLPAKVMGFDVKFVEVAVFEHRSVRLDVIRHLICDVLWENRQQESFL
jgi:hypothetical protein